MLDRLQSFLRAREAKASRTARLIALESPGRARFTPRDYTALAREGFVKNAVVHRSVRLVAEGVGSLSFLVYEGASARDRHPLLDLLSHPNPRQDGASFMEAATAHLLLAGNAYIEAVALDGAPRELYALRPDRMRAIPGAQGWPEAYEYTVAGRAVRFDQTANAPPILHLTLFHPLDDHYGLAPLEAAAVAVDTHNAAARWNKALLDNAARPSGALVYAGPDGSMLSEAQFERLKRELEETYQGASNAGRPLLLEGGLDWKAMSLSPKDMDFMEAKHAAAREIALAFGVPPMLLGIPGDNTYANYQEANRAFWRQTILPLANRIGAAFTHWLAPAFGGDVVLSVDTDRVEALNADRAALWERVTAAPFLTVNEKREMLGFGPLADGDGLGALGGPAGGGRKYDPGQPRVPAGDPGGGQWTSWDGGNSSVLSDATPDNDWMPGAQYAQNEVRKYSVNLEDEDRRGGHVREKHIGKTDEELLEVLRRNYYVGVVSYRFQDAEGSFASLESANDLVNRVLERNKSAVDLVASGTEPEATLNHRFGSVTGKEAYRPDVNSEPYIRSTYGVRVIIKNDPGSKRGYRVHTAFPVNRVLRGR